VLTVLAGSNVGLNSSDKKARIDETTSCLTQGSSSSQPRQHPVSPFHLLPPSRRRLPSGLSMGLAIVIVALRVGLDETTGKWRVVG
jgi:hypothetical protein